jgi:hypothetical protein
MEGLPTRARVFFAAVVIAAAMTALLGMFHRDTLELAGWDWLVLPAFGLLMLAGEIGGMAGAVGTPTSAETSTQAFTASVHVAAIILFGPYAAALIAGLAILAAELLRQVTWVKVLFNVSLIVVVVTWSGLLYELVRSGLVETQGSLTFPADYVSVAVLIVAYSVLNDGLLGSMLAFANDADYMDTLSDLAREAWPVTLTEGAVGVLVAYLAEADPWVLPFVVPPLVAVVLAYRNYIAARKETESALVAMADVVESRDPYTADHSRRVAEYAVSLGRGIGLGERELHSLELAGRLHDLGKIGVDNSVLFKPGLLTPDEYEVMQQHPELSGRILQPFDFARRETQYIHLHHERIDGEGYPYGLLGEEIPLAARILSIADAFDAMTTDRPYREGMSRERALEILRENAGTQFDAQLVEAFCGLYVDLHEAGVTPPAAPAYLGLTETLG